jgi:BirA family transcriptional regulator, biotin operon repressor / biotin---[acetyl-CoA-carboxylase] ligase
MRQQIFKALYARPNEYISGEKLSEKLGISRAAISKHISALKADGAVIESKKNNGHKLIKSPNRLKKEYVLSLISCDISTIKWFNTLGSTNDALKNDADDLDEISIYVSEEQTQGKGRRGRDWSSKQYQGIYFSTLLKPNISVEQSFQITCVLSLALVKTIKSVLNLKAQIKWPNDILMNGKKVCGTLSELSSDFDGVNHMVCGIGINVNQSTEDFPPELRNQATSLAIMAKKPIDRLAFFAALIDQIDAQYKEFKNTGLDKIISQYKAHSIALNKQVKIIQGNKTMTGTVIDINDKGELLLENKDGVHRIFAGEVSLRGLNGYV